MKIQNRLVKPNQLFSFSFCANTMVKTYSEWHCQAQKENGNFIKILRRPGIKNVPMFPRLICFIIIVPTITMSYQNNLKNN